jgi:hypothetical protein
MQQDDWELVDRDAAENLVHHEHGSAGLAEFRALLVFLRDGRWKKRAFGLFEEVLPHKGPKAFVTQRG